MCVVCECGVTVILTGITQLVLTQCSRSDDGVNFEEEGMCLELDVRMHNIGSLGRYH